MRVRKIRIPHSAFRDRLGRMLAAFSVVSLPLALGGCVIVSGDLDPFSRRPKPLEEHVIDGEGATKILLLDVQGVITATPDEGPFGWSVEQSLVDRVGTELDQATEDDAVKAVIVRINSPGGTVTASDIVYRRLRRFREERQIPVYAQLMDVAASGGYYVALAANEIAAYPTTVTGSIGVIFRNVSLEDLLGKIGVEDQTVKSGAKKDIGSPLRDMTEEERRILEDILRDLQARFLTLTRERRRLSPEAETQVADGRVLSAALAEALGLVDRVADLEGSIERARRAVGDPDARIVVYRRPSEYAASLYSVPQSRSAGPSLIHLDLGSLAPSTGFFYLWAPGHR